MFYDKAMSPEIFTERFERGKETISLVVFEDAGRRMVITDCAVPNSMVSIVVEARQIGGLIKQASLTLGRPFLDLTREFEATGRLSW